MRFAILGSCVTRDAVPFMGDAHELVLYAARTSFISLVSTPLSIDESEIELQGNFERRMLHWDLTKLFWQKLEEAKPEAIVIDIIDERFDVLEHNGSRYTRSNYLLQAGLEQRFAPQKWLKRHWDETHVVWRAACAQVLERIKSVCSTVIVHKAWWASRYAKEDVIVPFSGDDALAVQNANKWMREYYAVLQEDPAISIAECDESLCYSAKAHQWGRDFFHFDEVYYRELARQLTGRLGQAPSRAAAPWIDDGGSA